MTDETRATLRLFASPQLRRQIEDLVSTIRDPAILSGLLRAAAKGLVVTAGGRCGRPVPLTCEDLYAAHAMNLLHVWFETVDWEAVARELLERIPEDASAEAP